MYSEIQQGKVINIQGLNCNIPPEGYIFNTITKKLEYIGIHSRSEDISQQYWERIPLPIWLKDVTKREDDYLKKKKDDSPPFYDERYEEYKTIQWSRRLNGYWFYRKGKPTYITGLHYMFLQFWSIDIGYPKFRIIDLEYFYFIQYVIEDPICMGMLEVCKRRNGKSFRAGLFIVEYITRTKMTNGAIQSKTGQDAKKFFSKTIVSPFRKLPRFFRPEYDMSLGVNPKTEIRFQQTNIRGKRAEDNVDKDELGSMIDWQSADALALDGQKEHRVVNDEFAKTLECNIHDRHEVLRYCIMDEEGNIIGKLLYTSTVEKLETDRDGVQDGARLLWNESNQDTRQPNGRTISGLYRFFISAARSKNFDIYGDPDVEKTLIEIQEDRESVKDNQRALSARMRKEPLTIDEAFSIDADSCIFNTVNIANRRKQLEENPIHKRSIWFFRDEDTQKVKWRDILPKEKEFCWKVSPRFDLSYENANKFDKVGDLKRPARTKIGAIAIDGYSNSQGGEKWGSKASAWIGLRANDVHRKIVVAELYGRPTEKSTLYDQVMLAAEFTGFEAFFEHNSDAYYDYFKVHGKLLYLGIYPIILIDPIKLEETTRHRGTPTTPYSLTKQTDLGVSYFENDCDEIDFETIFPDAEIFDPNNRTKSDRTVSLLILIAVLSEEVYIPPIPKTPQIATYGGSPSIRHGNPALADY